MPAQVHDLVRSELRAPAGLRAVVVGGGRLAGETGRAARALGWPVLASYGLTEAGSQVATASPASLDGPWQSSPLPVLPIWEVRCDESGRISLRGPALFAGRMEGSGDEERFVAREEEWFATRDLGELDALGRLSVTGRADSLVKVLGELVDPVAIERALAGHAPAELAERVAVVALPDARAGHRLVPVRETAADADVAPGYPQKMQGMSMSDEFVNKIWSAREMKGMRANVHMSMAGLMTAMRVLPADLYHRVMETDEDIPRGAIFEEIVRRFGDPDRYQKAPGMM